LWFWAFLVLVWASLRHVALALFIVSPALDNTIVC